MNPLLNRLYQTKSRHNSVRVSKKRGQSAYDKQLIPKMLTKKLIQDIPPEKKQQRKKTLILKTKLPAIQHPNRGISILSNFEQQKQLTTTQKQKGFRQRKLSSHIHNRQQHSGYFATQLNLYQNLDTKHELFEQKLQKTGRAQQFKREVVVRYDESMYQGQQNEIFQYLHVLQDNEDLNQQFCYMNRGQLPYSYYIVQYQQKNPAQYLTVSLRGITQIKGQQTQFYAIKTLKRQIQKYRQIKKIDFFNNYIKTKVFKHWNHKTAMRKFQQKCKFIQTNLFQQNISIQPYLSFLHNTVQDFNTSRFISGNIITTYDLQGFKKLLTQSNKKILHTLNFYQDKIEKQLKQSINHALTKFRQQKRVTLGTNQPQQQSFLPYDSKKKDMKYTQMAKLKQFQGWMYKVIKYTDMLRFNTKIELILDGLKNYYKQFDLIYNNYLKRQSLTFVPWIHVIVQFTSNDPSQSQIICKPRLQQIQAILDNHRIDTVLNIIKGHRLWINRKQDFHCQDYQLQTNDQKPTRQDLKYYLQKDNKFILAMQHISQSLKMLIDIPNYHMQTIGKQILQIYKDSILNDINDYMTNQKLKGYLQKYAYQRDCLSKAQGQIQMGLVLINISQPIKTAKLKYQDKFKKITTAIPLQVLRRCQYVVKQVKDVYNQFKQNPSSIRQYLQFRKKYKFYKPKLDQLDKNIQALLQLQQMTYSNGIRIGQVPKLHIQQANTYYKQLLKRFQEIDDNQENDKKRFQSNVQNLIPNLQDDSQQLYNDLYTDRLITSPNIPVKQAQKRLFNDFGVKFDALKQRKQQLFFFQQEFQLGHNQLQNYFKLELNIQWFFKLWTGRQKYQQYLIHIQTKGYAQILDLDTKALDYFIKDIEEASSDLQAVQLLKQFKQDALKVQKVIKICKLMAAQTLQQEHQLKIKAILNVLQDIQKHDKNFKNDIFTSHSGKTVTGKKLIQSTNILEIQKELQEIVFISAQESIIKKKLGEMQQFWKKSRIRIINSDASQSGAEIPHLDHLANQPFHQKLGTFLLTLKNIEGSSHNIGIVAQKVQQQSAICRYLRNVLWKWEEVQAGWLKLLPLMTNCPAVKHQSNVYFQFTALDNTMRKFNRQAQQMPSLKKFLQDVNQGKFLQNFIKCGKDLIDINRTFEQFLQAKRATYSRFYFLADHQLITVLQNIRDVHSFAKYAGLCFNCQKIATQKDLVCGFQSPLQFFRLRKTILRGQPQQMFKSIQQHMRGSLKNMVAAMIPKVKLQQNLIQQFKDYPLQVMMIVDKVMWTQTTQNYLNASSYDDYLLLLKKPFEQMIDFLNKAQKDLWPRISMRLTQYMALKTIGQELVRDQITHDDFKWKQQLKYGTQQQELCITQFDRKIHYGYEYYPPTTKILVPTQISYRLMSKCLNACSGDKVLLIQGQQGQGKGVLIKEMATLFGCYKKTLVCNQNISTQYIMRFIQGAISAAAWLTFYQFDQLSFEVLGKMLQSISKIKQNEKCHPRTLFNLVHHGQYVQRISIYSFRNIVIVQPQKKKICEWLLRIYKFRDIQVLTYKILDFLETITPFLQKILGSPVSLLRRILFASGKIKLSADSSIRDQNIIGQVIQKQIIIKSEIKTRPYLRKALLSYFQYEQKQQNKQFSDKLLQTQVKFKQLINDQNSQKILLVGNRNCKTTILKKCLQNKQYLKIYPQSNDLFFTSITIEKINNMPEQVILVYDANQVLRQWNDLLTASEIYIQGQKITLKNRIILELRTLQSSTPSMVGTCKILYAGDVFSKQQKFIKFLELEQESTFMGIIHQAYGHDLNRLKQCHIQTLCKFVYPFVKSNNRNLQKIVIWFMSLIDKQDLWTKFYNGSPYDFLIHQAYQELVTVDRGKYQMLPYPDNFDYMIVPTKNLIVIYELINNLFTKNMCSLISGPQFSGKSSLFRMFKTSHLLSSKKPTQVWSTALKRLFTQVRRQGKNYLLSNGDIKILIQDIDLGRVSHIEYMRQIIDQQMIRDQRFQEYFFENNKILASVRKIPLKQKVLDRVAIINIEPLSRQNLQTIFSDVFHRQIKKQGMNKQVQQVIDFKVIKTLLICFEDLCNVYGGVGDKQRLLKGIGTSANTVISVVKNLLSLPKRNSFISAQNYQQYFMMHIWARLRQKNFTKKIQWQLQNIIDNALKVVFKYNGQNKEPGKNKWQQQFWLYTDKHVKPTKVTSLKGKIQQKFSNLVIFQQMLWQVLKLSNQYNCIDRNCLMVGRRGVGKKYTFQISCMINNQNLQYNLSNAISKALQGTKVILYQQYNKNKELMYQKLLECQYDCDLQLLIEGNSRQKYRQSLSGSDGKDDNRLVLKVKDLIYHVISMDNKTAYDKLTYKFRHMCTWPVVQLHQWPKQALIGIANPKDQNNSIHAQIFLQANKIVLDRQNISMPLMRYQKYLQTYQQLLETNKKDFAQQKTLYQQINIQFGQAALMVQNWQRRVNILQAELKDIIEQMDKAMRASQLQSFVIATLSKQLTQQQAQLAQKNRNLQKTKTNAQFKMQNMKKILAKIQKVVNSLQRSQLSQLKKVYKTNNEIKYGLQCVCVLLGQQQSQKSINKLLADPHLHWKMKSHSLLEHRNQKYTIKFKKDYQKYQKIVIHGALQTAKILFQWMKAIVQYWDVNQAYSTQSQDYQKLLTIYNQSRVQFIKVKQTLTVMDQKLKRCVVQFQHYTKKKQESQIQLSKIAQKLKNVAIIIPVLRKSQEQTKKIIKDIQNKQVHLQGNCILSAYSIIYLPLLKVTLKSRLLKSVKKVLLNARINFMQDFTNGLGNHADSGWQAINILALKHTKGAKIIIDPQRRALPYLLQHSYQEILQSIIQKAEQKKENQFDHNSVYHSAKQIKVEQDHISIDWKFTAFEPKQAIWNRIAQHKKPQYFEAKKTLSTQIRKNMAKLDSMKKTLYQKIRQHQIKILQDNEFIEIGQELLQLQKQTQETRKKQAQQLILIVFLTSQIQQQVTKIDTIYGHLRKFRPVSMQIMLTFACSQGDTIQNVLRWGLTQIQQQNRLGFLLASVLDIYYAKKLQNQDLMSLLFDNSGFRDGQRPKTKKPTAISNYNWDIIAKLTIYTQNFQKFFDKAVHQAKEFENWTKSDNLNAIPESFGQSLELSVLEKLVLNKFLRHGSAQIKIIQKIIKQILPLNITPFSAQEIINKANPKYPILINCDYPYFQQLNKKMNQGRIQRINLNQISSQYEMKKVIWAAMDKKVWLIINGIFSQKNQSMAQNFIYYVLNYDYQQSFRLFLYIDRVTGQRFKTTSQIRIEHSRYISTMAVRIRNDQPSVEKLFQIVQFQVVLNNNSGVINSDSPNKSFIRTPAIQRSPQVPPSSQLTLYRLRLLTMIIHTVFQYRRKNFFSLKKLFQALRIIEYAESNSLPLQFNIDSIAQSLGRIYSLSCPKGLTKQTQDLFERLLDQTKIHQRSIYGLPISSIGNIQENIKNLSNFSGITDAEFKRRDSLISKKSLSTAYDLIYSEIEVKAKITDLRSVLVRLPIQINFNQDIQIPYLKLMYCQQITKHNQRATQLRDFVQWINIYSNKDENNEQTDKDLIFNWQNLLKKISKMIGYGISKNQIRTQLQRYIDYLRRQHQFFLYWKISPICFMIQPAIMENFMKVVSSYKLAYFAKNQITEAHLCVLQPQFTNTHIEKDVRTQQGLLLSGMTLRQFKYHFDSKSFEPSTDPSGQDKCPVILLKFKRKMKRDDDQQYLLQLGVPICKLKGYNSYQNTNFHKSPSGNSLYQFQNTIGVLKFNLEGCYPQWGLRNPKFLVQ